MDLFSETEEPKPERPPLNESQQKVYDDVMAFLTGKDEEHPMWVFKGYAGTGKTFTLGRIVEELYRQSRAGLGDYRIAMSAPTHKAVRVMKKFSTFPPGAVHYATLHSLLGLKPEVDDHGKEKFVESKDPAEVHLEQFNILALDETSMTPDELFILLLKHVRRGLKILFIGDPVQIPPVNHLEAMPFKPEVIEKYNMGVSELTHIMRQAGDNPILRLATMVRMGHKTVPHFPYETDRLPKDSEMSPESGVVKISDDNELESVLEYFFVCDQFKADPDFMKVIAYTNKTVDQFNRMIRKRIYRADTNEVLPYIMKGEKLIVDKPVILPLTNKVLLSTNEEIEVLDHEIKDTGIEYLTGRRSNGQTVTFREKANLKYYNTIVSHYDSFNKKVQANICILHEDSHKKLEEILKEITEAAKAAPFGNPVRNQLWKSMYSTQRLFAQVKYNYAITAHKSQGSTYDNCLVLDYDVAICKKIAERNRIRYVAFTRARNLLFIQS